MVALAVTGLPVISPFVGVGILSPFFLNLYQMMNVSKHRKLAGVTYPNLYASDEEAKKDQKKLLFNCVQRAHQNTLENVPFILALTLYFGMSDPELAGASAFLWSLGRFFYTTGYATGTPAKRNSGIAPISYIGLITLFGGSIYRTVTGILATLK